MIATTPPCPRCQKVSFVSVDLASYRLWQRGVLLIQDAFPRATAEDRELLLTGTHPKCWQEIFSEPEGECEVCFRPSNTQWCPRCSEDA